MSEAARSPEAAESAMDPAPVPEIGELTVTGEQSLGERSTRYRVETDLIPAEETDGGQPSVVVTLPEDYDESRDYPVLYLLAGTAEGETPAKWVDKAAVEDATADLDAIVVSVDDGSYGWYSDWTVPGDSARAWRSFHLEQVVPWVDSTFPTIDDPQSRAIAGASAGGFGAMTYAEQRPDLFGSAASFSGLLSFDAQADRELVMGEVYGLTGSAHDLFGNGERTTQADWAANDPSKHTEALKGTPVRVYTGSADDFESRLASTSETFARAAEDSGAEVTVTTYGDLNDAGAETPAGTCGEGHEWTCWSMALKDWASDLQAQFDPE
ncbi:alpha/beta hydrolase [Kocuria soli]|uniref:alpha/beta hydrolase n=1 Tax=Kocuria soli TaxID=2485125 RepID=UPI00131532CA|nr:alpha/beta hydrolase-fold protein [Kocuria soli]